MSGRSIRVDASAAGAAPYDVIVRTGALADLPRILAANVPARRYAIIAPADVAELHAAAVCAALRRAGLDAELLTFTPGETSKTRDVWARLTDELLVRGFGRDCCVVAMGGGVAGDLAGFVAATYMRGVPLVHVPTTLLAMIDASVGGKTGVDTPAGKNLVGAFHPPALVVADPAVLRTLPREQRVAGLSEAVKHGAMVDASYFEWMELHARDLADGDAASIEPLVARSVELKARIVAEDPLERGVRAVLNFGHTIGHALEQHAGFALLHGVAVAAGMQVEARAGEIRGTTERGTAERISSLLHACGLVDPLPDLHFAELLPALRLDKKSRGDGLRCAVPRRIGEPARDEGGRWTLPLSETVLETAFSQSSREPRVV